MALGDVGLVSPGGMGARVGAAAAAGGHTVWWAGADRSARSHERAADAGLRDAGTLDDLLAACGVLLCVCPPAAAREVARTVADRGFTGVYVDANAVAPATAREIAATVGRGGATFVDGGIVGPTPMRHGTTRLYLSGERAAEVAALFDGSALGTVVLDGGPGTASALKMSYAAFGKGSTALLFAVLAAAEAEGVRPALLAEWERSRPELTGGLDRAASRNAPKAWRFVGEMHEVAATLRGAGVPGDFHEAAAEIYERLAGFKDRAGAVTPDEVVRALLDRRD